MLKICIVGLGGCLGAILRYFVSSGVNMVFKMPSFPLGTLTVNVIGCLLIGLGGGLIESHQYFSPQLRAFLFIGVLGSFTTFSTFGLETYYLFKNGQWLISMGNVGISLIVGIGAVVAGHALSRLI